MIDSYYSVVHRKQHKNTEKVSHPPTDLPCKIVARYPIELVIFYVYILMILMIGCLLAEGWWWRGREVGDGVGRHGNSVLGMT